MVASRNEIMTSLLNISGPIDGAKLHEVLTSLLTPTTVDTVGEDYWALTMVKEGKHARGLLRVAENAADGQTVTIGVDVFEVDIINTDSTDDLVGTAFANTTDPLTVDMSDYTHLTLAVGNLIRLENEILKVLVINGDNVTFSRARSGTTAASHAAGVSIYTSNANPTNIPVGLVTTLTPAVFTDALVDEINSNAGTKGNSVDVTAIGLTDNLVLLVHDQIGVNALATTETLGATNLFDAATLEDGLALANKQMLVGTYVPIAAEVTEGNIYIPVEFTPAKFIIFVTTSAGVAKPWTGAVTAVAGPPKHVKITNEGTSDWAATDLIHYVFIE